MAVLAIAACCAFAGLALADAFGPHFRVSFQGHDGDSSYTARYSDVAYDPQTDHHLVVFVNSDPTNGLTVEGQLVDEAGGLVGGAFPISSGAANPDDSSEPPSVNYDATNDQYLVTWYTYGGQRPDAGVRGNNSGSGVVYAQRVSAGGALLGANTAVSTVNYGDIETTDAAWSPEGNEWLVAWKDAHSQNGDLGQIYGRLLGPDSAPKGSSQLTLTHFPETDSEGADDAMSVAYNSRDHDFMAVVRGLDSALAPDEEDEVYGQLVGLDGSAAASDFHRISNVAPLPGKTPDGTNTPRIAYNANADQYLVGWSSSDGTANGNIQDWAQRVAADGSLVGAPLQVSDVPSKWTAYRPDLAYDPAADLYLVTFHAGTGKNDLATYGDYVSGSGSLVGTRDFSVSDMGSTDLERRPAADYNSRTCDFMTVWDGTAAEGSLAGDQNEIWGRRVAAPPCPAPAAVTTAPSDVTFTTGTLHGFVNLHWQPGDWHFEWGTTTAYGNTTAAQAAPADGSDHPQTSGLTGLAPGTTYHYRIVAATSHGGTAVGADQQFTTPAPAASRRPARGRIVLSGVRTTACTSSARLTVHIRVRSTTRVRSLTVSLDGRRIATRHSGRATVHIRTRGLSMRRHRLTIVTRNAGGTTRRTVTFRRCAIRMPRFTG